MVFFQERQDLINRPNNELALDIKDNEDSDFTFAELNINISFSDLSEKELSETEINNLWWDNNLGSENTNLKGINKTKQSKTGEKLTESASIFHFDTDNVV